YQFFWHELCDWYIEFVKPEIVEVKADSQLACEVLIFVFDQALRLLHPFMPFITEELWQRLPNQGVSISIVEFPRFDVRLVDDEAERKVGIIQGLITNARDVRVKQKIDTQKRLQNIEIELSSSNSDSWSDEVKTEAESYLKRLIRADQVTWLPQVSGPDSSGRDHRRDQFVSRVLAGAQMTIPLGPLVLNTDAERTRLEKEIAKIQEEMTPIQQKLLNPDFLAHAPEQVVKLN